MLKSTDRLLKSAEVTRPGPDVGSQGHVMRTQCMQRSAILSACSAWAWVPPSGCRAPNSHLLWPAELTLFITQKDRYASWSFPRLSPICRWTRHSGFVCKSTESGQKHLLHPSSTEWWWRDTNRALQHTIQKGSSCSVSGCESNLWLLFVLMVSFYALSGQRGGWVERDAAVARCRLPLAPRPVFRLRLSNGGHSRQC